MTTYNNLPDETDRERELRMIAEHEAYVVQCKTDKIEPINFMNWLSGRKFAEKVADGKRAFERREKRTTKDERERKRLPERRKVFVIEPADDNQRL